MGFIEDDEWQLGYGALGVLVFDHSEVDDAFAGAG